MVHAANEVISVRPTPAISNLRNDKALMIPSLAHLLTRRTEAFLESIFIDQATLNGTRPDSPSGVKPARPLVGLYFMVQFQE